MIFVIIDHLTKMMHYKRGKVTIDASNLIEIIINIMI